MTLLYIVLIVSVSMFIVGLIDSVAGGGGLISLPVFLLVGLPPRTAFGTNKIMSLTGSTIVSCRYWKNGFLDVRAAIWFGGAFVFGDIAATFFVYSIPEKYFEIILSVILPIAALFVIFGKKSFTYDNKNIELNRGSKLIMVIMGVCMGFYSGTIAAACATLGMILLSALLHYDVRVSTGTIRFALLLGDAFVIAVYIYNGDVNWLVLLPAVCCYMMGCFIGSKLAIENGARLIRPVALIVVCGYAIKTFIGFFG